MKKPSEEDSPDFSGYLSDISSSTASTSGSLGESSEENYRSISAAPALDSDYFRNLPSSLNILTNTSDTIRKITDPEKQRDVVKLLLSIQNALLTNRFTLDKIGSLPPLRISLNEDDSVLIEWTFRDFRIGFSIEPDRSQSNWYLVSNQNLNQVDVSGLLSSPDIDELITSLIAFVLSNT